MPNYRELLQQVKSEIDEVDVPQARELLDAPDRPLVVDVRELDEWTEGRIPGAIHIPRGNLESRIEQAAPDRAQPIFLYCAAGNRSAFAAKSLEELGYENVVSLAGGYTDWKRSGLPTELPRTLDGQKRQRYSRHVLIPEVGEEGQLKLLDSRVLLLGAGGLGSPSALYLAAAGVGRLGIVDDDHVDASNLQRQVLHSTSRLGEWKAESAKRTLQELNPDVEVVPYIERLTSENVERILADGWDVIVDGADNFPTRYLINDAAVWHDIPLVHGSIYRFEGQATVFKPRPRAEVARGLNGPGDGGFAAGASTLDGPCYRCLFPQPPPPELAPSCAEGGVLGVLPGIVGSLQASEALKLCLGIGEPLVGRLLLFDALATEFSEVNLRRDPNCPVCGDSPTITEYVDYVEFCSGRPAKAASVTGEAGDARPGSPGDLTA
jgi:sulfur-carrier protein adenylyltransferase/sulfurtransferase